MIRIWSFGHRLCKVAFIHRVASPVYCGRPKVNDHKMTSYGQINEVFERKIFNISYPSFSISA